MDYLPANGKMQRDDCFMTKLMVIGEIAYTAPGKNNKIVISYDFFGAYDITNTFRFF